jgi:hypothetical protein
MPVTVGTGSPPPPLGSGHPVSTSAMIAGSNATNPKNDLVLFMLHTPFVVYSRFLHKHPLFMPAI